MDYVYEQCSAYMAAWLYAPQGVYLDLVSIGMIRQGKHIFIRAV